MILYSSDGTIVLQGKESSEPFIHWNVSEIPVGLYLLEILYENGERNKVKLVKSR